LASYSFNPADMGKTQCKSNSESSGKQLLHATNNGKVEKKECERCTLLTRATYILESQVEKITWKAFLLSEQKRQQDEYVKYIEERLQDSEKRATDVIVTTMPSHHEEGETICMRESVVCQREQQTDPVGHVEDEVNVEVTAQTLALTATVEKGNNEDKNVVATACEGVEYSENIPLTAEQHRLKDKKNKGICFWCLKVVRPSIYSHHTRFCIVRRLARNTCCECGGLKVTHRNCSHEFKVVCNFCGNLICKYNWDKHSMHCGMKSCQFRCTCKTVLL
jgi:hypothetical protein